MGTPAADRSSRRVRLFVALTLPAATRGAIAEWAHDLFDADPALRLVPAEALHVTLAFLGSRDPDAVDGIAGAVSDAVAGHPAPRLTPRGLTALPPGRPRVLALDLLDDAEARAGAIQGALEQALATAGIREPESRPFRAHVTVARVRKNARPRAVSAATPPIEPFVAPEVVLYRSELRPDGARYSPLGSTRLTVEGG